MGGQGMTDIHSPLLHGLDGGSSSLEESIEMYQIGYRDGMMRECPYLS